MTQPGAIGGLAGAGDDWIGREFADLKRRIADVSGSTPASAASTIYRENFAISNVFATLATINLAVPRGFTRALITAHGLVHAYMGNYSTGLATADNNVYAYVQIGSRLSGNYTVQFAPGGQHATANHAFAYSFTGLDPAGSVIPCVVRGRLQVGSKNDTSGGAAPTPDPLTPRTVETSAEMTVSAVFFR